MIDVQSLLASIETMTDDGVQVRKDQLRELIHEIQLGQMARCTLVNLRSILNATTAGLAA